MPSTLTPLLERFNIAPAATRDELRNFAECDPAAFRDEAIDALRKHCKVDVRNYIVSLLVRSAGVVDYVADATKCGFERAVTVAKAVQSAGTPLDELLEDKLAGYIAGNGHSDDLTRILDLLLALGAASRAVAWRPQLMKHSDPKVRAKSARVIAAGSKSLAWVASVLTDRDFRVQANAVEALWDITDADVKPLLTIASRSLNARVAANALLGLYRRGALESIPALLKMATHANAAQRVSAVWAIGETMDARFLPYLARAFDIADAKEKQVIIRALARIRRQLREFEAAGALRVNLLQSRMSTDRSRRLVFTVAAAASEVPALGPMHFALSEDDKLVIDYSLRRIAAPPLMIFGFILPRFTSMAEPYAETVAAALNVCTSLKRPGDLWCFKRYRFREPAQLPGHEAQGTLVAPEDAKVAVHKKNHHGLLRDAELIRKVAADPGPRDRAAKHVAEAIEAAVEISERVSGVRHLFVFFGSENPDERPLQQLANALKNEAVTVHGFALEGCEEESLLRQLCESTENGSFEVTSLANLGERIQSAYLNLMTRYEINYQPPDAVEPRLCTLLISSPHGCARESIDFRRMAVDGLEQAVI